MEALNYIILIVYILGMVAIAVYTRKRSKSVNDFLMGGEKGLNGWMSAFAYGTTYFSAVIFVGYAGKFGWNFGLSAVWIGVGNAILGSLVAWKVLAKRTKNMTARLQAKTMPEFFEKRYDSKPLKYVTAVIIFLFLIPYSASVYNGLGTLFSIVFHIPDWTIMIALAAITALYLFFGGYFATALSDFIQGIIMLVGVIVMVFFFLNAPEVNWGEGIKKLTESGLGWFVGSDGKTFWLYDKPMTVISLVLLTSWGVWGLPQTIHKYYAVRDKKAINQGMIVSTLFALIIGFGAYFVGAFGTLFFSDITAAGGYDNIIPQMLAKVIPNGFIGLIAVLILSASMSTLSSVSLASASVVAIDLYKGANPKAQDKQVTMVMRVLCLIFIAISVILALLNIKFNLTAIAYLMALSWGVLSGCFMGPFVCGLLSKKITKTSVWVSVIGGLTLTASLIVLLGYHKAGFACTFAQAIGNGISLSPLIGIITMIFSVLVTVVISCFTKKPKEDTLYTAFEKPIENEIK